MNKIENEYIKRASDSCGIGVPKIPVNFPIQYGQCAEDYLVLSLLRTLKTKEGLDLTKEKYCEIGANHPISGSSTYLLNRGIGMTGVLVEANPDLIQNLIDHRPDDVVEAVAISAVEEPTTRLYIADSDELSTINLQRAAALSEFDSQCSESLDVPSLTIDQLMQKHFLDKSPLFMSVDIEGADLSVLKSFSFSIRPAIIQIEFSEDYDRLSFDEVSQLLSDNDYVIVMRTDVNQIAIDALRYHRHDRGLTVGLGSRGIAKLLDGVELLTLDVFDTILARACTLPTDVFYWMEEYYNIPGFCEQRIAAEAQARRKYAERGGEVSLDEVYSNLNISRYPDIMNLELDAEKKFLYLNPSIICIIDAARSRNIKVVAISDIYLYSDQVRDLLNKAGVYVDEVYTSADYKESDLGKYNSKIFPVVAENEGCSCENILHIGDNEVSDVDNARKAGLRALHTEQLHKLAVQMDEGYRLISSVATSATARTCLGLSVRDWSRAPYRSRLELFGYNVGGPLVLGFAKYIVNKARRDGVKRLILLERDGIILAEALNIIGAGGVEYRTAPASRRMCVFPTLLEGGFEAIASLFAGRSEEISAKAFFESLSLGGLAPDEESEVIDTPRAHFARFEEVLRGQAKRERNAILKEFSEELEMIRSGESIAWVDVGWALSSVRGLNSVLGVDEVCYCIGSHINVAPMVRHSGYLFEKGKDERVTQSLMNGVELLELIFSSSSLSTAYLFSDGDLVKRSLIEKKGPASVRDAYVDEVNSGTIRFIRDAGSFERGLNVDSLRDFSISMLVEMCELPGDLYTELLGKVPHDRFAVNGSWEKISDYWKPQHLQNARDLQRNLDTMQSRVKTLEETHSQYSVDFHARLNEADRNFRDSERKLDGALAALRSTRQHPVRAQLTLVRFWIIRLLLKLPLSETRKMKLGRSLSKRNPRRGIS